MMHLLYAALIIHCVDCSVAESLINTVPTTPVIYLDGIVCISVSLLSNKRFYHTDPVIPLKNN
jgi:hypothetical protein